jgi:hypothetical protein
MRSFLITSKPAAENPERDRPWKTWRSWFGADERVSVLLRNGGFTIARTLPLEIVTASGPGWPGHHRISWCAVVRKGTKMSKQTTTHRWSMPLGAM